MFRHYGHFCIYIYLRAGYVQAGLGLGIGIIQGWESFFTSMCNECFLSIFECVLLIYCHLRYFIFSNRSSNYLIILCLCPFLSLVSLFLPLYFFYLSAKSISFTAYAFLYITLINVYSENINLHQWYESHVLSFHLNLIIYLLYT